MPEKDNSIEIFHPTSQQDWRHWLEKNHELKQSVWLVQHNKASGKPSVSWSDAVDVALCYGWIDSKKISVDHETSHQFFSKRKAKGTWSKINKNKIAQLMAAGLMAEAGLKIIDIAKENGSWTILDEVEELIIPADLEAEFTKRPGAKDFFLSLSKSIRKSLLQWIVLAKRPETRYNRLIEIADAAEKQLKPTQFR